VEKDGFPDEQAGVFMDGVVRFCMIWQHATFFLSDIIFRWPEKGTRKCGHQSGRTSFTLAWIFGLSFNNQ
jgi:hypothetical protein